MSVYYLDDILLFGNSPEGCEQNVNVTLVILRRLGFYINYSKSSLVPSNQLEFLGFELNSTTMLVKLPARKCDDILKIGHSILEKSVRICELASFIGLLVSTFPAVNYGPLFIKFLELDKINALSLNFGNFDAFCTLRQDSVLDINWWISNVSLSSNSIEDCSPSIWLETEASSLGWGAVRDSVTTGGRWSITEQKLHINVLEIMAALFGLQSLCRSVKSKHIRIRIDVTAVSYINKMGGTKSNLICVIVLQIPFGNGQFHLRTILLQNILQDLRTSSRIKLVKYFMILQNGN